MPRRSRSPHLAVPIVVIGPVLVLVACIPSPAPSFDSASPNARLEAIAAASNASDETSLRRLVEQLDADDPAARMLAITALQKRTGETFGYVAADPDWKRREAFERWEAFLAGRESVERPATETEPAPQTEEPRGE